MNRFSFVSKEGVALPDDADFSTVGAIRVNATGLLVAPLLLNDGKPATWKKASELAAAVQILGQPARLPEVEEGFHIPDRTRHSPALDPHFFPFLADAKPRWFWSATACAWFRSSAWYVSLYNGSSSVGPQYHEGLVLAVRGPVASPGQ